MPRRWKSGSTPMISMTPMRSLNALRATVANPTGRRPPPQRRRLVRRWCNWLHLLGLRCLPVGLEAKKIGSPRTSRNEAKTGSHARRELHDGAEVALLKFSDLDYLPSTRRDATEAVNLQGGRCAHEGHVRRAPFMPKVPGRPLRSHAGRSRRISRSTSTHQLCASSAETTQDRWRALRRPRGHVRIAGRMADPHSQPRSTSTRPRTAQRSQVRREPAVRPLALVDLPARELPASVPRRLAPESGAGAGDLPACPAPAHVPTRSDGRVARLEPVAGSIVRRSSSPHSDCPSASPGLSPVQVGADQRFDTRIGAGVEVEKTRSSRLGALVRPARRSATDGLPGGAQCW